MSREIFPLVSVITTTFNKFQYLYETLESIFMQDYPNIELIIGDDGSSVFPRQEIEQFIEAHRGNNISKVCILHEDENHGTVWNCHNCRSMASGVILMGIASDDRFYDEKVISDVVAYFQKTGAEIVTCKREYVDAQTGKAILVMPDRQYAGWIKRLPANKLFEKMGSIGFISGSNTYYTRDFYDTFGGFDRLYKYIEDYPFFLKVLRNGVGIRFYDRISIKYRYGAGISTAAHKNNQFRDDMYKDRIRYMEQEILPFMDNWPWWRKEQMKTRLRRFQIEKASKDNNKLRIYMRLFFMSPVGTIAQLIYMGNYMLKIEAGKRG